ncbi:hypothetical protein HK405_002544 [Cladochytrium tenue]|nr:hypothetical protein HK405_002544 [Cladochytrium tenue]
MLILISLFVGDCFGGRPAILLSATDPLFDAFAVAHLSNLQLPADAAAVACPGLVCLAEDDPSCRPRPSLSSSHGYAVRGMMQNPVIRKACDQMLGDMAVFCKKALV